MKTKELVYMILDLIKSVSDDSDVKEEHALFLLNKYRGTLLQLYHNIKKQVPTSNYQLICLSLEEFDNSLSCFKNAILRSTVEVPDVMNIGSVSVYPQEEYYIGENIVLVPRERMKFVGHNKWLKNFIYCSIGPDKKLYFTSSNPQLKYLTGVSVNAVFEDVEAAAELDCSTGCTDIMDLEFPIEVDLVPLLCAMVAKDLLGAAYRPKDGTNNASDDLSDLAYWIKRNMKSAVQKLIDGTETND